MKDLEQRYIELKKAILTKHFSGMNPKQQEAVFHKEGPLLILAGAGSGKTTVLVNRIANMIEFGNSFHSTNIPPSLTQADVDFLAQYQSGASSNDERMKSLIACQTVKPWNILAITFTNKAAGELKERLKNLLGEQALDIQASTFHSACVRILRSKIDRLGYKNSFTIYDSDDSMRVIKEGLKEQGINDKTFAPRTILSAISAAKDKFLTPKEMLRQYSDDFREVTISKIYDYYQKKLKAANAVDFDDIIVLTVRILEENPDVLEYYQNRFKYVMVDEYQDTNNSQYRLVSLLSQTHHNIAVVGDDDQSIYKFRGATIENIMSFEEQFPQTQVVKLEQNYRCTQNILDAANRVIGHNTQRKGKELWTDNGAGDKIQLFRGTDEQDEGRFIADTILDNTQNGASYSDHVILYRMNAQSNTIENCLIRAGVPYKMIGGLRFYERKEIKDVMAYLSVVNNPDDTIRLKRIINEPKRGIGDATLAKAEEIAANLGLSLFEVLRQSDNYQPLVKKASSIMEFTHMLEALMELAEAGSLVELLNQTLENTGYTKYLLAMGEEGKTRIENVEELKTNILKYELNAEEPSLGQFLEEVTLYNDLDSYDENADNVVLMTMHSAKGLEFPYVFFCGAEEGIFPGMQSFYNPEQIEEERRLAYVCITRAKKQLYVTNAGQRMLFGHTVRNRPSRFVAEIPVDLCDMKDNTIRKIIPMDQRTAPVVNNHKNRADNNIGVGSVAPAQENMVLAVGDKVMHRKFGTGIILKITPMGGDHYIEAHFENEGIKKIMQTFARLQKI